MDPRLRRRRPPAAPAAPVRPFRPWRPVAPAVIFAALAFAASLTPSLIPRTPLEQGVLAGLAIGLGYACGALASWLWRLMLLPEPSGPWPLRLATLAAAAVMAAALWQAPEWQDATRRVMDLPPVEEGHRPRVAAVALATGAALWVAGVLFVLLSRRIGGLLARGLPGRLGPVLGVLLAALLVMQLGRGVLLRQAMELSDAAFAAGEQAVDPRFAPPENPMATGSAASLISWEDLGNRGRDFIGRTPEPAEIEAFTGRPAKRPVRVYVGRVSAPTAEARAKLALEELIRQGGFEREILIVTTPVGTGWMDPGAHDTVDFMFNGDTAHVAAQYSYLTSILSILTQIDYGFDQARALFDVIHGYWSALPPESRPRLYIHGLSQGALNSQSTLPIFDVLADPPQGAFWAGSPFMSPIWSFVRDRRAEGSPAWRPVFGNGSMVRTANQENTLDRAEAPWGPIRFVFLNYGSDPIVVFDPAMLWRPPDWLTGPRAPDVAPEMRWFPLVTAFQLGLDMLVALSVEGHGHYYVAADYIDAWAALADPPDWSEARARALAELFRQRPAPW
ncbi:alpha/beta-hydrolase family protein [Poseidonocella sp. HB161398]|uniref:alpha/beta hydrolase n=1 Tax=Poseidonocella sp. HB161398 TaxID=2320855 RepID=UPI001109DAE7|nr:alpha/beta-hydrolase family protein [Poseidonocella sp. HB161398]